MNERPAAAAGSAASSRKAPLSPAGLSFQKGMWTAVAVLVIAMAAFQIYDVIRRLEIVVETTELRFASITQALAEQTADVLEAVDGVLSGIDAHANLPRRRPTLAAIRAHMETQLDAVPHIRNLFLLDRDGNPLIGVGNDATATGAALKQLLTRPDAENARSGPGTYRFHVLPRSGANASALVVERRIPGRDHAAVVALVEPGYFRRVYRAVNLGPGSEVVLFHRDGGVIAVYNHDRVDARLAQGDEALYRDLIDAPGGRATTIPGAVDGEDAIFAARAVPNWPLAVGARIKRNDVLAPWYTQAMHSAVRTTLLCISVIVLMWVAVRQLTRRERAEHRLGVQTALLDELFESAPEAIVMLDPELRITRANREFTRLFGYPVDDVAGGSLDTLIVPETLHEEHRRLLGALRAGRHIGLESERHHRDGSRVPVSILGAPIVAGGRQIASYLIFRDMTERRLAEAEQSKLETRLRQAEKLEAIGTMAGGIVHDFNNILAAILGYGDMARNSAPSGGVLERYIGNVLAAANRAKALVDQILSYSRTTRSKPDVMRVSAVVKEAVDLIRVTLPASVELRVQFADESATIIADPTQVHQLVMNLCRNAIHAMDETGTLTIEVDTLETAKDRVLSHGLLPGGRYVRLTVSDTGSGMDEAVARRILEPFFTGRASGSGTGLGLAIVHGIVTELGGAIHVETHPGHGTRFELYLPRSDAEAIDKVPAESRLPRGRGEQILLVEDEKPLMLLTEEMLAALSYEPAGFTSPAAALAEFRAAPERFDAVLLDQVMPGMTGIELARQIRARREDVPILLISGYLGPLLHEEARRAGVDQILAKPLDLRELARAVAQALHRTPVS